MARYRLTLMAKADLQQIYRYGFFEYGEKQADRYYEDFFTRFDVIAESPFLYPAVDHIREGYRRAACGAHAIYYRVEDGAVEIMRVLGRQDTSKALR